MCTKLLLQVRPVLYIWHMTIRPKLLQEERHAIVYRLMLLSIMLR